MSKTNTLIKSYYRARAIARKENRKYDFKPYEIDRGIYSGYLDINELLTREMLGVILTDSELIKKLDLNKLWLVNNNENKLITLIERFPREVNNFLDLDKDFEFPWVEQLILKMSKRPARIFSDTRISEVIKNIDYSKVDDDLPVKILSQTDIFLLNIDYQTYYLNPNISFEDVNDIFRFSEMTNTQLEKITDEFKGVELKKQKSQGGAK